MLEKLLAALQIPAEWKETRKIELGRKRLAFLGLAEPCSRCGGSGNYSYNQMDGSRCYGCGGTRYKLPANSRITKTLIAKVEAAVAAGGLEPYFAAVNREHELAKAHKKAAAMIGENSPISPDYSLAYDKYRFVLEEKAPIAKSFRTRECDRYKVFDRIHSKYSTAGFRLGKGKITKEEFEAVQVEYSAAFDQFMIDIAQLHAEYLTVRVEIV